VALNPALEQGTRQEQFVSQTRNGPSHVKWILRDERFSTHMKGGEGLATFDFYIRADALQQAGKRPAPTMRKGVKGSAGHFRTVYLKGGKSPTDKAQIFQQQNALACLTQQRSRQQAADARADDYRINGFGRAISHVDASVGLGAGV
jgi:hypothetical protein